MPYGGGGGTWGVPLVLPLFVPHECSARFACFTLYKLFIHFFVRLCPTRGDPRDSPGVGRMATCKWSPTSFRMLSHLIPPRVPLCATRYASIGVLLFSFIVLTAIGVSLCIVGSILSRLLLVCACLYDFPLGVTCFRVHRCEQIHTSEPEFISWQVFEVHCYGICVAV